MRGGEYSVVKFVELGVERNITSSSEQYIANVTVNVVPDVLYDESRCFKTCTSQYAHTM
jgi:hypothetical protein